MGWRTRLASTGAVLLVGVATTACGGGAPGEASKEDFCAAQSGLFADLDLDSADPAAALPTEKEMAEAMHAWADELEEVGTPEGIPEDARKGFEETIEAARGISAGELESPDPDALEGELSQEAQRDLDAFSAYVSQTCGSVLGELEMPELPQMPAE